MEPIIIIGAARSGTNALRDVLTRIDSVATWPCDEINPIWRHYWASFPSDELRSIHATDRVRRYVRSAFERLSSRTRARFIVEKTCANSLRVDYVRTIFPEAKFVFIVRDGRDVVASAMRRWQARFELAYTLKKVRYVPLWDFPRYTTWFAANRLQRLISRHRQLQTWGPRFDGIDEMVATHTLAEVCAEQWRQCVEQASVELANVPAPNAYMLRYEDFVTAPESQIESLVRFLGVSLARTASKMLASGISPRSVGKWRQELNTSTVAQVNSAISAGTQAIDRFVQASSSQHAKRSAA